mgnify:CR=1 FL=1
MGFLFVWILGCTTGAVFEISHAAGASVVLFSLMRLAGPRRSRTVALLGCALLGMSWGAYRNPTPHPLVSPEGTIEVSGIVTRSTRVSEDRVRSVLTSATIEGRPLGRALSLRSSGRCAWPVGYRFTGLAEVRSRAPAVARLSLVATARSPGPEIDRCQPVTRVHERVSLPNSETSGLLRALSLGDRSGVSHATREAFIDTGTMHLLAISGLHLGVVAWGLYRISLWVLCLLGPLSWTQDNPRTAAGLSVIGVWSVVSQIQGTDATLRAAWGITFVLCGLCWGRRVEGSRVLCLAAAGVVTWEPLAPLGASFQLSFLAVWAILRVAPLARRCREHITAPGRVDSPLLKACGARMVELTLVNLAATAVTAPLGLAWFGQLSLVGPLVNLVATPWVAVVVVPAVALWVLLASVSPELASLSSPAVDWVLGALLDLLEVWAELAGSSQRARWPLWAALGISVGCIGLLGGASWRRLSVALVCASLLGVQLAAAPPPAWQLTAINVGHGDALLVQGPEGQTALVDAGGHPRSADRGRDQSRWLLLPALSQMGVDHLDLMIITHGDLDHVGGAAEVARRIPVGELWLSRCPQRRSVDPLVRAVFAQGGRVVRVQSGAPIPWGEASLEVLWPPRGEPCPATENDRSVVLKVQTPGGSALLMGDASQVVESSLLGRDPGRLSVDVLKVGHHGSDSSSSTPFIGATGAQVALVSGPGRARGPLPSIRALERLRRAGLSIWVTGRDGTAQVVFDPVGSPRARRLRTP